MYAGVNVLGKMEDRLKMVNFFWFLSKTARIILFYSIVLLAKDKRYKNHYYNKICPSISTKLQLLANTGIFFILNLFMSMSMSSS